MLLLWLVIGGFLTLAPRLAPGANSGLANAASAAWLLMPVSMLAALIAPSRVTLALSVAHLIVWLGLASSFWGSLPK